jgi:hypothetical protein
MDDNLKIFIVITITLILSFYSTFYIYARKMYWSAISGYWIVDEEFRIQSKMSSGCICITDDRFLINLESGGNDIVGTLKQFKLTPKWIFLPECGNLKNYVLKIIEDEYDDYGNFFDCDEMKTNIRLTVDDSGTIEMYCGDVLYFKGYKHPELTKLIRDGVQPDMD